MWILGRGWRVDHRPVVNDTVILEMKEGKYEAIGEEDVMEIVVDVAIGPHRQWHSLKCLESGTVLLEAKNRKYESLGEDDILVL